MVGSIEYQNVDEEDSLSILKDSFYPIRLD